MFTLKDLKEKKEKEKSFTIPEHGPHVAEIVKAVEEENSVGTGSILKLTMTIEEGPSKGVLIYDSINFSNVDEYTQKKGRAWLYYLNKACGFEEGYYPSGAEEYLGKKLVITLSDKQGEAFNVTRYEPLPKDQKPKTPGIFSTVVKKAFGTKNTD